MVCEVVNTIITGDGRRHWGNNLDKIHVHNKKINQRVDYRVFHVVTDPTIRQPGFNLPHHTWSLMNRFRTGQGLCRANLHKRSLAQSPSCDSGQRQLDYELHSRHVPINKI